MFPASNLAMPCRASRTSTATGHSCTSSHIRLPSIHRCKAKDYEPSGGQLLAPLSLLNPVIHSQFLTSCMSPTLPSLCPTALAFLTLPQAQKALAVPSVGTVLPPDRSWLPRPALPYQSFHYRLCYKNLTLNMLLAGPLPQNFCMAHTSTQAGLLCPPCCCLPRSRQLPHSREASSAVLSYSLSPWNVVGCSKNPCEPNYKRPAAERRGKEPASPGSSILALGRKSRFPRAMALM